MTFFFFSQFTFSPFLFGLLFPFSFWTFISLFYLDFYFPFLFGLLFPFFIWNFLFQFEFQFDYLSFNSIILSFNSIILSFNRLFQVSIWLFWFKFDYYLFQFDYFEFQFDYFEFQFLLISFSHQSRSHFGFLPNSYNNHRTSLYSIVKSSQPTKVNVFVTLQASVDL